MKYHETNVDCFVQTITSFAGDIVILFAYYGRNFWGPFFSAFFYKFIPVIRYSKISLCPSQYKGITGAGDTCWYSLVVTATTKKNK